MLETGIGLLLGAAAALAYALYCRAQAVRHRQKGVNRDRVVHFDTALLTELGRSDRARYYVALLLGFLAALVGFLAAAWSIAGVGML